MKKAPIPSNEIERQESLNSYCIVDSPESREFDRLTNLAAKITNCPISLITLLDNDRNWFKSRFGIELKEDPRDRSFCGHAINRPEKPFIITDTRKFEPFADNPAVTGDLNIQFYAGFPIVNSDGYALGTLCILDHVPRELTPDQISMLEDLSVQVLYLMEHWKKEQQLILLNNELLEINKNTAQLANIISNDIHSPLVSIQSNTEQLIDKHAADLETKSKVRLLQIYRSAKEIKHMVDGLIDHNQTHNLLEGKKKNIDVSVLIEEVIKIINPNGFHKVSYPKDFQLIRSKEAALKRILINLLTNCIRHHNKDRANVDLHVISTGSHFKFSIKDDGPGVHEMFIEKAFEIYNRGEKVNPKGVGIGLASAKKLVLGLGGEISMSNHPKGGLLVEFTIPN